MFKKLFSIFLIALFFLSNFGPAQAQVEVQTFTPTPSNLPLVYVTEIKVEKNSYKPGETLKGEITLLSKNKTDANNLSIALSLVEDSTANNTGFVTEVKRMAEVSIKSEETKVLPFEFVLPNSAPSKLKIKAQVTMSSGLPLGWEHSQFFSFESNSSYLSLIATRLELDNNITYPTDYGPHIYRDKKPSAISAQALVINTLKSAVVVVPEIVVYKWPKSVDRKDLKTRVYPKVSVNPGKDPVTISVPLPNFDYDPGVYEGVLYLKDENGDLKTAEISFRYIIGGDVVTIHSLSTAKGSLAKGEIFDVKAFVTGTPIDLDSDVLPEGAQNVSLELKVFNEKNSLVASETKEIALLAENNVVFSLSSKKESKSLRGELVVRKDGKEIKRYSSNLSADFVEVQDSVSFFEKYFIYIISVAVLFVLYLSYVFVFKKSLKGKAFVFAVLLSLGAFAHVRAFTWETGLAYNTPVGVLKIDVFINKPIEDQVLRYGDSFNIEGSFIYPYCSNSSGSTSTISTWITKGDGSILDLNSDGAPDYQHKNIESVATSSYSIPIGCDAPNHCWSKPSKIFSDNTSYLISPTIPFGNYRAYIKINNTYTTGAIAKANPAGIFSQGYVNFSVKPPSPSPVTAETSTTCGRKIKLSWPAVQGVTGYAVYRSSSSGGSYGWVANVSTTTYTNTVSTANRAYYYKVLSYHTPSTASSTLAETTAVSAVSSADCQPGACVMYSSPVSSQPSGSGLCTFGLSSPVVSNTSSYDWTCLGESPTIPVMCSAPKATSGTCDPAKIYNVDKCCPVALVAGTCPPPPTAPSISATTYCTPPSVASASARVVVNSAVGSLPIYHNIYSVSATSSFRTFLWTLTQTTPSHTPYFEVTGLATSTYVRYAATSYNSVGQSSSSIMMYPIKTPRVCPVCPDGVTPMPSSGICPVVSLIDNSCTFVKDDPTDPEPARVNRWFGQLAHATGSNPPFTLSWSGDVPAADFSISTTASTSKLRTRYDTPGLKKLNMRVRDSAGNEINRTCDITVYCPDGTLNCAGTLIPSISRIDNSCLFPTTKNTIYFNSNSTNFPVSYVLYRKKTGDPDTSYVRLGNSVGTYIQNTSSDKPVFVDDGLPMVKSYTYRVWASNAYNFNVYSTAVSSTTGFCSGTVCPDGRSALSDGTCQVFSRPTGELILDELFVWPPRVTHGQSCNVYIRKTTGDAKKLFASVPPEGANCSITGPIEGSFPGGIDPTNFNTKSLFDLAPTGDIYFISKPVTGTSLFEVSCSDGSKISNVCQVAPVQSDTSFIEKIFKIGTNFKESLVGAILFSLGFGK